MKLQSTKKQNANQKQEIQIYLKLYTNQITPSTLQIVYNKHKPALMSSKPYEQQQLDRIKKRQLNELNECPKAFFELLSFMEGNLRKQFKSFSLLNLCQGSSHKLRFNDAAFEKAFASMMISERLEFYERAVGYGVEAFGKGRKPKQALDQAINQQVKQLLPQGYKEVQLTIHEGFRSNQHMTARIQKFKLSSRNHFHLNLQNYLLRQSKKNTDPQTYILQAINKSHPLHVRFSFVNANQQRKNYDLLRILAELAFRSTVNSMILPDTVGISPTKLEKRQSIRKSMGRLAEPKETQEEENMPSEQVRQGKQKKILASNQVLEYSRHLAEKKRQARKPYPDQDNSILNELLQMKPLRSQSALQSNKNIQQPKGTQNIFNKVLQSQSDIKLPYNNNQGPFNDKYNHKIIKKDTSPIRGFVSSEVKQYTGATARGIKYKNVFEQMLPEFNLREIDPNLSVKIFKEIYISTTAMTTILQHNSRPDRFQCRLVLQNLSVENVYCTLINQELLKHWNHYVDQSQIKITLTAENCLICYQKHKRFSTWFKQRDYLFLRHAFTYHQCKYIVDKSIQHTSFIPFQSIQRGYVRHVVTRVRQMKQGQVEIVVDMSVEYGGYLGVERRKELNLNYLKQYENLKAFINQQITMLYNMPSYCNTQWNIDWIDEANDGSFPQSLTLKSQDFLQGSQIDQIGVDNVQLQSEDFFSIKDQDQLQQPSVQPSTLTDNNFQFQTTQGFEQQKPFAKRVSQRDELVQQKELLSEKQEDDESNFGEMTTADPEILLNDEGYCVLPQKYFRKRHPILPKQKHTQERHKTYENIIMKGDFVENMDGGILLVNKAKIDAQNNVINFIMKTMRKNLLSGKSILSISLPVQIFKADSNTQRLCQSMTMGPQFLEKASLTQDPLQRMKLSICFALSNSLMYFDIEKPFNPILGETYQAMIDGCPIYAEQVSHHPPITSIYFIGRGFKVHASLEAKVFLHLNSGQGVNQGFYSIVFDDGNVIKFQTAPGQLSGFTIGDRKYRFKDKMYVYDKKHSYFSALHFQDPNAGFFSKSKWQHPDQMQGQILKVTPTFINKFQQSEDKIMPKQKQIESTLSKMTGRWIHYLNFDGNLYYNIDTEVPYKLVNYQYALNSDARYRQDLIYRVRNDLAKSQIYKENLENKQRRDRKLREQYDGKKH